MLLTDRQKELLTKEGFSFDTLDDALMYLDSVCDYLVSHNKNYTKEQYTRIDIVATVIRKLAIAAYEG